MFTFILHKSLSFNSKLEHDRNRMKMKRERSETFEIHTTFASFSFNFDHLRGLILKNYE
jgi:hypothetical protein